eukprot:jgi/Antlo1/1506/2052
MTVALDIDDFPVVEEEAFDEELLEKLYADNNVTEELRVRMRLWTPSIPSVSMSYLSEQMVANAFRRKMECIESGKPYSADIREDGVYVAYSEIDNFGLFFTECTRDQTFECNELRQMVFFLVDYRKKMKEVEIRLIERYSLLCGDVSGASGRMRALIKESVDGIRNINNKLLKLQACIADVCSKAEDTWSFLRRAYRICRRKELPGEASL